MIPILSSKGALNNSTDPSWFLAYSANHVISGTSTTISGVSIGTAAAERRVIVLLGGDSLPITDFEWETNHFSANTQVAWGRYAIQGDYNATTGTSGELIINWASDLTGANVSVVIIVANNVGTFVQWNGAASAASSGTISTSVSTGSSGQKGLVFATLTSEFQLTTSWQLPSGITKQLDRNVGSRRHSWAVYESNGGSQTVRAYQANTWNDKALLAVAFRKT